MKRPCSALVEYDDSDSDEQPSTPKRKLPKLSSSLVIPVPSDDPSKHQGRTRTVPHVDGQFAAYVYIPVVLEDEGGLVKLIREAVKLGCETVPGLMSDWDDESPSETKSKESEVHISLSRPIYLRHYQREDLKRAVKRAAQSQRPFTASFASFTSFDNDERTRSFLALEIGAGHEQMKSLANALGPTLDLLHQRRFYEDPRFHASIGWALYPSTTTLEAQSHTSSFTSLLSRLSSDIGPERIARFGVFEVSEVKVKIGKEVFGWPL